MPVRSLLPEHAVLPDGWAGVVGPGIAGRIGAGPDPNVEVTVAGELRMPGHGWRLLRVEAGP